MPLILLSLTLPAQASIKKFSGDIRDRASSKILYRYQRTEEILKNGIKRVERKYMTTDNRRAALITTLFKNGKAYKSILEHDQLKENGIYEVMGGKVKFRYTLSDGSVKTDDEKATRNLIGPDEIGGFLQANWEKLKAGETLAIRFPVWNRQETVGFKFFKDRDSSWKDPAGKVKGKKAMVIKMKPSSFIIAALVDPLYFWMDHSGGHDVLMIDGRTTPKMRKGDSWKDLDALAVFHH